jgi:UDP-GlcNAc:undecaprenyl-phosphate GlcNAc-1-phosphate transferase
MPWLVDMVGFLAGSHVFLLALTVGLAFLLSLYGVPIARQAAMKFGMVDAADGRLKHQREPIPYLGGLAIYLAFLVSLGLTFEFRHDVLGMVLAGTLMLLLGLIDDFGVLSPATKLIGQLLAIFVLIKSGIRIQIMAVPDWLDVTLTVIWMLGITNAFNLLDIMDGLAAGVGVISATFLLGVAVLNGDTTIAFMLAALAGSLLGFLRYNFHPARIYMGDAGSLFLGLMLGALAMTGSYTDRHPISLVSPLLILGVPIFDTVFVMYIRFLRGLPIFLGSPDHMPLRLRHWGLTVPQVVCISYVASIVLGVVALIVMTTSADVAMALIGAAMLGCVILTFALKRVDVTRSELRPLQNTASKGATDEQGQVRLWS